MDIKPFRIRQESMSPARRLAFSIAVPAIFTLTLFASRDSDAALLVHQDVHEVSITEGLNGTWRATSLLNITTGHPHTTPVGGRFGFESINIFTGSASLFTPLFLPGSRIGGANPTADMDLDNSGVYETDLTLAGPAVFDYSTPWTVRLESNRTTFNVVEFTFGVNIEPSLTVGEAEVSLGGVGLNVTVRPTRDAPPAFETSALPDDFNILTTPTSDGIGFLASGGRIVIRGFARDTAPGNSTLTYDNPHWLSGEGPLVDDFTRANDPGVLTTSVFDQNASVSTPVPEPSSVALLLLGLGMLGYALKRDSKNTLGLGLEPQGQGTWNAA